MTAHAELMEWLAGDMANVHKFLKAIDKLVAGRVVLVVSDEDGALITGFMSDKRHRRVRRS